MTRKIILMYNEHPLEISAKLLAPEIKKGLEKLGYEVRLHKITQKIDVKAIKELRKQGGRLEIEILRGEHLWEYSPRERFPRHEEIKDVCNENKDVPVFNLHNFPHKFVNPAYELSRTGRRRRVGLKSKKDVEKYLNEAERIARGGEYGGFPETNRYIAKSADFQIPAIVFHVRPLKASERADWTHKDQPPNLHEIEIAAVMKRLPESKQPEKSLDIVDVTESKKIGLMSAEIVKHIVNGIDKIASVREPKS